MSFGKPSPDGSDIATDYQRLRVFLNDTGSFLLGLATYGNPSVRARVIESLSDDLGSDGIETVVLDLCEAPAEVSLFGAAKDAVDSPNGHAGSVALMIIEAECRLVPENQLHHRGRIQPGARGDEIVVLKAARVGAESPGELDDLGVNHLPRVFRTVCHGSDLDVGGSMRALSS